jgi:lipopolysaccharide export system protein LptA
MTGEGSMLKTILRVIVLTAVLFTFAAQPAALWSQSLKTKAAVNKGQPIHVDSDRLDAYNAKRMVVFSGNVVAVQGLRTMRAATLTIYYKDDKKTAKESPASGDAYGDIDRMEAKGNVSITEGERVATGDNALFEQETQKITMTGNAVLKEGKNVIKGNKVVVFLEEDRGVVESGENQRVTATIFPSEKH